MPSSSRVVRITTRLAVPLLAIGSCETSTGSTTPTVSTTPAASSASAARDASGRLRVDVEGLRSTDGGLLVYLHTTEDTFPSEFEQAFATQRLPSVSETSATVHFENLPPGTYAVVVAHDENGNGVLDRSFIGFPQEGVGASNVPKGRPTWSKAQLTVDGDTQVSITMQYL